MLMWTKHGYSAHSKDIWGTRVLLAHHLPPIVRTESSRPVISVLDQLESLDCFQKFAHFSATLMTGFMI